MEVSSGNGEVVDTLLAEQCSFIHGIEHVQSLFNSPSLTHFVNTVNLPFYDTILSSICIHFGHVRTPRPWKPDRRIDGRLPITPNAFLSLP